MDEIDFTKELDDSVSEDKRPEQSSKQEELILESKRFIDSYKKELKSSLRDENNVVYVDFMEIAEESPILSEELIKNPEEALRILEIAIEEMGLIENVRVRLFNLQKSDEILVRNIRSKHLNELILIEGIIRQSSDVRPQVVNAKFECPSCGTIISVLQMEKKFREPSRCSCGRRGGFKLLSKEMVDTQRLIVEEAPDMLQGGEQPKRINVFVKEDLVDPKMEERTTPGSRVKIIGILKEVPVPLSTGGMSTRFELALEVNNIIPMEETFEELDITEEDEQQIQELAADPKVREKLRDSIAPSVWGYEEIKESLLLQLFGGVQKQKTDGQKTRGDIHIMMIGDPGVAKSVILNFMANISPKGRYVVGKSTSGAGLTASVVRDEYLKGWSLEAGAMVLANKGLVCIDELEKMDPTDQSAMHEAMEQQCMLPDFKLTLSNGKTEKIGEMIDKLIEKNKKKVEKGKDCEILSVKDIKLLSTDFQNHFPIKADRVSRHLAPKEFIKIELANGREITVTPEHPCWIIEKGKIKTTSAEKLKEGEFFPIPSKIKIQEKSYKKENDYLCKLLGYHISDGSYELNRSKKIGIQFWNNDKLLIEDYKNSIEKYFKIKPIITKRKNQFAVRVISKSVFEKVIKLDKNLLEKGNLKKIPESILEFPKENLKYLLRALYDGDGSVSMQKRNGCRISFVSQNKDLEEQMADLLLRFEIQSSIFYDNHSKIWRLDISGQENLKKFLNEISFLSQKKKQKLKEYCEIGKSYKTIRDVVPNCTDKINEIFKRLKISAKKEIGHSIDLHVEKQRVFLQKLTNIALKKAYKLKDKKTIEEIKEMRKLAFGFSRWVKIKKVSKVKNKNIKWVYDVTIEPYHTFISNGMILHNTVTISKANVQACYSEDTETLTEEGWKNYKEVKNLKIAQYDTKEGTIQFLPHNGLHVYKNKEKLYQFKNKRNDILVTPEHKMLAKEERQKEFKQIKAKYITYSRNQFINSGNFLGKEKDFFILPAIKHKQNRKHKKYVHQHKDKKINMNLWLEFLGYYITEGGIETIPTIGIVQKKGEKAKKIEKCLKKLTKILGCSLSKIDTGKYLRFKITQTQVYEFLKNLGKNCYNKKLNINFSEYSKEQLKILFSAMMLEDGSKNGKSFSVTSSELADEMQIIAHLIGKSASKNLHYEGKKRGNRKDTYRITISDKIYPTIRKKDIKKIKYSGKVYCFSTKTGFFVTRRKGKIAIQGNTLRAQTSVLAAANPKFGRFDPSQGIPQQINLPPALINRFDIIFTMRDIPNLGNDTKVADHILEEHQREAKEMIVDKNLFRKYIAYARQRVQPKLTDGAVKKMKDFYVELRNRPMIEGQEMRTIPISARQLNSLIRMAEATAKLRMSEKVEEEDAEIAINLLKYYLMQVGFDEETGEIDIDKISGKMKSSQRNKIFIIRDTIYALAKEIGELVPIEKIEERLEGKITPEEIEDAIEKLAKEGTIYKPRRGYVQKL